jgi:hypothetical protein
VSSFHAGTAALAATVALAQAPQPERIVGFVRAVEGTWEVRSPAGSVATVARGQTVPARSTLTAVTGDSPRIVIARAYGPELSSCSPRQGGTETCVRALTLPDAPAPTPFVTRMWEAVAHFFSAPKGTFVETLSRGGSLRDGVVPVDRNKLDLGQVIRLPPGSYRVLISRPASFSGESTHEIAVTQTETACTGAAPAGLAAGMYALTLSGTNESARILVGPSRRVGAAWKALQELDRASAEWSVEPVDRHGIRRAVLLEYARSIESGGK